MGLNYKHKGRGIWLSGVRGTGKSTLFCKFLREYPCDHLLVFDHKGEYADRLKAFSCFTFEECDHAWAHGRAVLFNPTKLYPGEKTTIAEGKQKTVPWGRAEAFADWCRWARVKINADPFKVKLFAWDESGSSVPVHSGYNSHPCRQIVEEDRVAGCDLLWATQQTNQANNQLRNQATDIFAYRHEDQTACDYLLKKGWKWEEIQSLQDGEFIYRSNQDSKLHRGSVTLGT